MRTISSILLILFLLPVVVIGQTKYNHDTISFNGYIGVIADSMYAPYGSRNIFPKQRFKPTSEQIKRFENLFIEQYDDAIEKHHKLFYEEYNTKHRWAYSDDEWKQIEQYKKDGKKKGQQAQKRLKKEFDEYNRIYYGYIGRNGMKYIRIEFEPHKEKWVEIPGTGESHLKNYPPLVFNLSTSQLSLAGWTGENDE